jgi:hypothetical protein
MGASSIVGMTPEMLLASARAERDSGHRFNAAMLYAGVQGTIDRGSAFQLGIAQTPREDLAIPIEICGKPSFVWNMQGKKYSAVQASTIGHSGTVGPRISFAAICMEGRTRRGSEKPRVHKSIRRYAS